MSVVALYDSWRKWEITHPTHTQYFFSTQKVFLTTLDVILVSTRSWTIRAQQLFFYFKSSDWLEKNIHLWLVPLPSPLNWPPFRLCLFWRNWGILRIWQDVKFWNGNGIFGKCCRFDPKGESLIHFMYAFISNCSNLIGFQNNFSGYKNVQYWWKKVQNLKKCTDLEKEVPVQFQKILLEYITWSLGIRV